MIFLFRSIRGKYFPRQERKSREPRPLRRLHEDDGNESSFISISGIVGQVLARKADTAAACRLRASHEGESYFHAFSTTVSVMSEYTFDIATSKSSVEYGFTRGIYHSQFII